MAPVPLVSSNHTMQLPAREPSSASATITRSRSNSRSARTVSHRAVPNELVASGSTAGAWPSANGRSAGRHEARWTLTTSSAGVAERTNDGAARAWRTSRRMSRAKTASVTSSQPSGAGPSMTTTSPSPHGTGPTGCCCPPYSHTNPPPVKATVVGWVAVRTAQVNSPAVHRAPRGSHHAAARSCMRSRSAPVSVMAHTLQSASVATFPRGLVLPRVAPRRARRNSPG